MDRYRALVDGQDGEAQRTSSITLLALAALRAGTTAVAAIRADRYVLRNDRWVQLASTPGPPWRAMTAPSRARATWPTLDLLVLDQAIELARSGLAAMTGRYERGAGEAFAEVRVERARIASEPQLVFAIVTDVTDRVREDREVAGMRARLAEQERLRALGELASGIAHDLNNTLHALSLRLSRIDARALPADRQDDLHVAARIAAEAAARVRRLQELARRRADRPEERVNLGAVIASAADAVRGELARAERAARPIALEVRLPRLPPVVADAGELRDVVVNLLVNARDAMPSGGTIEVDGSVAGDGSVEVRVADRGGGILPDHLGRIFDPFFTTKGRRGTGLGLSIAASVMRRLGGSVSADNRDGGGAVLTLRFPPCASIPRASPAAPPAAGAPRSRRVLVVDDDADNLEAMRLVLEQLGQEVDVAQTGRAAVDRIHAGTRYDLVLTDLGLGDASGWDVADSIRAAAPATRVVLVTGWAQEIPPDDPRRGTVEQILAKPLDVDDLARVVGRPPGASEGRASAPAPLPPP